MDSEILFRGKDKYNGEWVFGDFFREWDVFENLNSYIFENPKYGSWYEHEIIPETVGWYTGSTDKNGVKIFKEDIVKAFLHNETPMIFSITFRAGCFWYGNWTFCEFLDKFRNVEVIGNIHDNPELLEPTADYADNPSFMPPT